MEETLIRRITVTSSLNEISTLHRSAGKFRGCEGGVQLSKVLSTAGF
jgi:hypothetical protein